MIKNIFDVFEVSATGEVVDPPSADVYYAVAEQEGDVLVTNNNTSTALAVTANNNTSNNSTTNETNSIFDYIFGSFDKASAVRSVSPKGIEIEECVFSKNYRAVRSFFIVLFLRYKRIVH